MSSQRQPTALEQVRAYHQRTKHRFQAYARGPETLDWDAQPAPFRQFAGAPAVGLPRLAGLAADSALARALGRPFGELAGPCAPLPVDAASLGALLQLSLGLTAWKSLGPDRWAVRANPSSGNLHPAEAYLVMAGVAGFADGLYHYRPEDHALELRARHAPGGPPRLAVLLASVMWRETWKYGERAFRYCQLDTGHALAALRYAAALLGWRLVEDAAPGTDTLARLAGLDREAEFPARRDPATEREEAEVLLALDTGDGLPDLSPGALRALAGSAEWFGVASPIDPHPMYRWPQVGDVAAATRAPDRASVPRPPLDAPPPRPPRPTPAAQALILGRRSAQRFDHHHRMPLADFAALLARLQPVAEAPWDALASPPRLALLLFVSHVEGLAPGLYLLPRAPGQREALARATRPGFDWTPVPAVEGLLALGALEPMALQRLARSLHCHQDLAATACFAVGMLADFEQALAQEGAPGYRGLFREAGVVGQALYLEAEALGLRGTGIGCFFDDPVHELLGLADGAWQSLYHFTVGLPVTDPRIESAPAYAHPVPDLAETQP